MRLKTRSVLAVAAAGALLVAGGTPIASATIADSGTSTTGTSSACLDTASAARTRNAKAHEPKPDKETKAYGKVKPRPLMKPGSVTVPVAFHMLQSKSDASPRTDSEWTHMVNAQIKVLNDSYGGLTGGADSPFRFRLDSLEFVKDDAWYTVTPGATEFTMKRALYEGDAHTLNVYAGNIGDGILGWAYYPQDYKKGHGYLDGVVMLDESMPGGNTTDYSLGDTLTHELGHWFGLLHTFEGGCSASNDFVLDTPREAEPQFECPTVEPDTCTAPGLDPIHNFMDYSPDACMYMFTQGQAQRMNDAWIDYRRVH